MKKVILNKCYGGFSVSPEAYMLYCEKKGIVLEKESFVFDFNKGLRFNKNLKESINLNEDFREDLILIEVVEELGEKASGDCSKLVVVQIPDNLDYVIDDYDGYETLHQKVQTW